MPRLPSASVGTTRTTCPVQSHCAGGTPVTCSGISTSKSSDEPLLSGRSVVKNTPRCERFSDRKCCSGASNFRMRTRKSAQTAWRSDKRRSWSSFSTKCSIPNLQACQKGLRAPKRCRKGRQGESSSSNERGRLNFVPRRLFLGASDGRKLKSLAQPERSASDFFFNSIEYRCYPRRLRLRLRVRQRRGAIAHILRRRGFAQRRLAHRDRPVFDPASAAFGNKVVGQAVDRIAQRLAQRNERSEERRVGK